MLGYVCAVTAGVGRDADPGAAERVPLGAGDRDRELRAVTCGGYKRATTGEGTHERAFSVDERGIDTHERGSD
ncbi:hypothetical protein, partial [Halorubrum sp. SS7]|uniref:hypothetical protein n=1 Tax=Halorubrum sp. SS7 TaxID=2518119 RepID=UPI001A7E14E4